MCLSKLIFNLINLNLNRHLLLLATKSERAFIDPEVSDY